ncbi:hypothetical protein [Streptomyces kaempferi]|uniref:Uncharacterized protein n=1 Tax=Streptomyces kaempferi TaxID=333725 RepID=A0ABW3XG17_9ACTN
MAVTDASYGDATRLGEGGDDRAPRLGRRFKRPMALDELHP